MSLSYFLMRQISVIRVETDKNTMNAELGLCDVNGARITHCLGS